MNYLIIYYNTPELTTALCSSLLKQDDTAKIYLFDNSDKLPFRQAELFNVEYIDNTKNQLIDFDKELSEIPNLLRETQPINSNHGSYKHARSVEWFMSNFNIDDFILLDSDILIKENPSIIKDASKLAVGHINLRFEPFMLYINLKKCKENNIHFLDKHRMVYVSSLDAKYDTGGSFYEDIYLNNLPYTNMDLSSKYIHFGEGSWKGKEFRPWLLSNKILWSI